MCSVECEECSEKCEVQSGASNVKATSALPSAGTTGMCLGASSFGLRSFISISMYVYIYIHTYIHYIYT